MPLFVGQVSQGSPGFSAVFDGACGCQGEDGCYSLWACGRAYGVTWGLRPKVVHWLYIPSFGHLSHFHL
jgi:hypothetical protein